jgi:uncharacterized protein YbaR (Trm112 family)
MSTGERSEPLVCPSCATTYPLDDRFCPRCKMPLVYSPGVADSKPITERHERARKVKPQLAEGELMRVAGARNLAEAEFIQSLLLEEGVPSLLRRSAGFDVPDFLAAGPRDILVPAAGVSAARDILLQAELISTQPPRTVVAPIRLMLGLLAALALGVLLVWAATQALS